MEPENACCTCYWHDAKKLVLLQLPVAERHGGYRPGG